MSDEASIYEVHEAPAENPAAPAPESEPAAAIAAPEASATLQELESDMKAAIPAVPGLPEDASSADLVLELLAQVRAMQERLDRMEEQLKRKRVIR